MRFVHQDAETSTVSQGQQIHRAYNALDLANDMQGPLSQVRIEIVSGGKFSRGNVPKRGHAKFLGSGTGFRLALVVLARR
jgi:hypothetical protein